MTAPYAAAVPTGVDVLVEVSLLVDVDRLVTTAWRRALAAFLEGRRAGAPPDLGPADVQLVVGAGDVDAAAALLESRRVVLPFGAPGATDLGTLRGLAARWRREVQILVTTDGVQLHPWAHDLLATLRASSARHAVVSAALDPAPLLSAAGVAGLVPVVTGPPVGDTDHVDPVTQVVLRHAMDELDTAPGGVHLLAGTPPLVEAGRHLGLATVAGVATGDVTASSLHGSGADRVVDPRDLTATVGG